MIGRVLAGRYELIRLLGRGGMGEVWEARDARIRRGVAVKLLPHDLDDPSGAELFLREGHITGGLRHPGVVTVFDLGREPGTGTLYLVMELLEGHDLARELRDAGPPEIAVAVDWSAQVAAALSVAHANGVVHRDLKPSNLMLTTEGTVKVLDFGIARFAAATTRSTAIMGTLAYMAPERVRGRSGDARGDLYSLGWVLHELLTGKTPFGTTEPMALMYAHLETPPERPGALRGGVPPELDDLILALLAKNPDDRPNSAAETLDRLNRIPSVGRTAPSSPVPRENNAQPRPAPPEYPPGAGPTDLRIPAPPPPADAPTDPVARPDGNPVVIGAGRQTGAPARRFALGPKPVIAIAAGAVVVALVVWLAVRGSGSGDDPSSDAAKQPTTASATGTGTATGTSDSSVANAPGSGATPGAATAAGRTNAPLATAEPTLIPGTSAQKSIVEAYSLAFDGSKPIDLRKGKIQDADRLDAFIDQVFANPILATVTVAVHRVDVGATTAEVLVKWLTNGIPTTGEIAYSAVLEDGRWVVGADAICSLGTVVGAQVPSACSEY
ncbi:serine/threonine-protein kinase [Yinghuangia sp. YIM S09857]|uniref:serine/threonine-protein kinase n=1 Tax=Yinghuangia sp. YIM S09857 TaxID=3436929 RepID=UPI003F531E8E